MQADQIEIRKENVTPGVWAMLLQFLKIGDDRTVVIVMVNSHAHKLLKRLDNNFLLAHEKRVVEERDQLADRIAKLAAFVEDRGGVFVTLDSLDQQLMVTQLRVMRTYHQILNNRINRF